MVKTKKHPETGETNTTNNDPIREKLSQLVEKSRESNNWESIDVLTVDGQTTSIILSLAVNTNMQAVMFTVRTPKLAGKPNMLKLPTLEHIDLLLQLADKIREKRDKLKHIFETVCELLGTSPERKRPRRTTRETLEI